MSIPNKEICGGHLNNIYYNTPNGCFFDLATNIRCDPFSYTSLLGSDIESMISGASIAVELIKNRRAIFSSINKSIKFLKPKRMWPLFFPKFLSKYEGSQYVFSEIIKSREIGRQPPSTEIYHLATEELWSIQVNYSAALRTNGLNPLISAIKKNKKLKANICLADPQELQEISKMDIKTIYQNEGEQILQEILANSYPIKDMQKFLYPAEIDYIRKLNDSYAALSILNQRLREEQIENRVHFWTYNNVKPTLRATFVKGEKNIIDFIYFPENWIGMAGTLCRFDLKKNRTLYNDLFEMAEIERESMRLQEIDLQILIEDITETLEERILLRDWRLDKNRARAGCINDVRTSFVYLDNYLRDKCSSHKERNEFLDMLTKIKDTTLKKVSITIIPLNP